LAQMIAMRYGCLPIVSAVGGLKDTVVAGEDGFVMGSATAARLATTMRHAMQVLVDRPVWTRMQQAAMARDFSWSASARRYFELYQQAAVNAASHLAS